MNFQQTGLPERAIFQDAFNAGWDKYMALHDDAELAASQYLRGPVAMARLIYEHGGDCRHTAVAACLAGPAVFSAAPAACLNARLIAFSHEIRAVQMAEASDLHGVVAGLSGDARLFFQASAILLLEQLASAPAQEDAASRESQYTQALTIYSAARGAVDVYKLDTRFEIAAMKATTEVSAQPHIWTVSRRAAARQSVHA